MGDSRCFSDCLGLRLAAVIIATGFLLNACDNREENKNQATSDVGSAREADPASSESDGNSKPPVPPFDQYATTTVRLQVNGTPFSFPMNRWGNSDWPDYQGGPVKTLGLIVWWADGRIVGRTRGSSNRDSDSIRIDISSFGATEDFPVASPEQDFQDFLGRFSVGDPVEYAELNLREYRATSAVGQKVYAFADSKARNPDGRIPRAVCSDIGKDCICYVQISPTLNVRYAFPAGELADWPKFHQATLKFVLSTAKL